MVRLQQDKNGNFLARKRLPDDVRDEYGRRHGARYEAKFSARASLGASTAKQKFREWDAEVTARIDAIRAERKGDGVALTRQQARALAGEWYRWFIARHPTSDVGRWDAKRVADERIGFKLFGDQSKSSTVSIPNRLVIVANGIAQSLDQGV